MQQRLYTALKDGQVVSRGTFQHEDLLKLDFPAPEYELVLDEHLEFAKPVLSYADQRRAAYPPLSDLADALFWQAKGDNSRMEAYLAACAAVKDQYPKPTQ